VQRKRPCGRYTTWPLSGLSPSAREFHPLSKQNANSDWTFQVIALTVFGSAFGTATFFA